MHIKRITGYEVSFAQLLVHVYISFLVLSSLLQNYERMVKVFDMMNYFPFLNISL
jgi:hypothetical protein